MSMDPAMASAFASGSGGIDPGAMKAVLLTTTGGAFMLVLAWIIGRLWHAQQDERITPGEFMGAVMTLAAVVTFLLLFLGLY